MSTVRPYLTTIPVEILLEIVRLVAEEPSNTSTPTIGFNAAWVTPMLRLNMAQPPMSDHTELNDNLIAQVDNNQDQRRGDRSTRPSLLKLLRSTCRYLNNICIPFLYDRINLLTSLDTPETLHRASIRIIIPHWQHIRCLSVCVDLDERSQSSEQEASIAGILTVCKNLTSLALYYYNTDAEIVKIAAETLKLIEKHRLVQLGIYSLPVLWQPYEQGITVPRGVIGLLDSICSSELARSKLVVLDIVIESVPLSTWGDIRTYLTSLRSLTIRRALRQYLGRVWDPEERLKWAANPYLTKLQLINCQPAYAPHIPHVVRHFPALRELMISTCGDDSDIPPPPLPSGWNTRSDALCKTRSPLDSFHIEHMEDWEIKALGVIPTRVLVVTTVKRYHLLSCLKEEPNLFPGITVLRLTPLPPHLAYPQVQVDTNEGIVFPEDVKALEAICKSRGIELRRDAEPTWSCLCCGIEGY